MQSKYRDDVKDLPKREVCEMCEKVVDEMKDDMLSVIDTIETDVKEIINLLGSISSVGDLDRVDEAFDLLTDLGQKLY
jgi:hypothetical protein